jgi:bifunctional ADP-heptose synthase (sugar kinase/adenylyltransferase)
VLIKGKGYKLDNVVGADIVKSRGGDVVLVDQFGEHSTTDTILRLISVAGARAS